MRWLRVWVCYGVFFIVIICCIVRSRSWSLLMLFFLVSLFVLFLWVCEFVVWVLGVILSIIIMVCVLRLVYFCCDWWRISSIWLCGVSFFCRSRGLSLFRRWKVWLMVWWWGSSWVWGCWILVFRCSSISSFWMFFGVFLIL